jgi:hypothetical protein
MSDPTPYNPLDKKNLGASVAEALLGRKPHPLGGLPSFHGAGIYAIYYKGDFRAYQKISERHLDIGIERQRHAHAALDKALGLAEQAQVGVGHAQGLGHAVEHDAWASTPP